MPSAALNSSSAYTLTASSSLIPNGSAHTLFGWFYFVSGPSFSCVFAKTTGGADYKLLLNGGHLHMYYASGVNVDLGAFSSNAWHSWAMAYSGSNVQGYLDGVAVGSNVATTGPANSVSLSLGEEPGFGEQFVGYESEVGIWQGTTLNASQIAAVHALAPTGLTLLSAAVQPTTYWPMTQLVAGAFADAIGSNNLTKTTAGVTGSLLAPVVLPATSMLSSTFVTLNGVGIAVDVAAGVPRKPITVGVGYERRFAGNLGQERRGFKREFTLTAAAESQINVNALRHLLNDTIPSQEASGDHWRLDGAPLHWAGGLAWSDKGQNAITLAGTAALAQTGGKWSTGGEITLADATAVASFTGYTPAAGWIVGCWHNDAGTWNAYLFFGTSHAVAAYKNGAAIAVPSWVYATYSADVWQFLGTGTATDAVSDVFMYPFLPPLSWAAGMQTLQQAQEWPAGGTLLMGGDIGSGTVKARSPSGKTFESQLGAAAFADNNEMLDFILRDA